MPATIFSSATQLAAPEALLESFLSRPRNTPSAVSFNRAASEAAPRGTGAEQLRALFCRMPLKLQACVRQLTYERMILEAKVEAMLNRLRDGEAAWGSEEGELALGERGTDALARLTRAVADSDYELKRAVGSGVTRAVLQALWAPDMREAVRLSVVSEDEARALHHSTHAELDDAASGLGHTAAAGFSGAEAEVRAGRLWRRRLWKLTIPVRIDAKLHFATAHDDYDNKGHRTLINDLNKRNPEDAMSNYQKQRLKYARNRRGSTSIAGAWEGVVMTRAQAEAEAPAAAAAAAAEEEEAEGRGAGMEGGVSAEEAALLQEVGELDRILGDKQGVRSHYAASPRK